MTPSHRTIRKIVQNCRIAASHLDVRHINFFGEISPEKLVNFQEELPTLQGGEKKQALLDSSLWSNGNEGALVTDRAIYTRYGKQKRFLTWTDVENVFISDSIVHLNDRPAFVCGYNDDEKDLFFHMVYDIYRSLHGQKMRLPSLDELILPSRCVACLEDAVSATLDVPVYGAEKLSGSGNLAQRYAIGAALLGSLVVSVLAASLSMSLKKREVLATFAVPFCKSCLASLSSVEKNLNASPLVIDEEVARSFYGNRYFSIEMHLDTTELWFKNSEYANEIISLRG